MPREHLCAIYYGPGNLRLERAPVREPGPREALIEVAACGVCATDAHTLDGDFPLTVPPVTLGHEYAGTVRAVGADVTAVAPGDAVTVDPSISCHACYFCHEGELMSCEHRRGLYGGFAEYATLPDEALHRLPAGVELEAGAFTEPLACALHAVTLGGVRPGDRVAIVGAGIIGLLLLQLVRLAGAARVVVSDPLPERRARATELGAALTVDPLREDLLAAAADLTGGVGVDVAIEAVGARQTVMDCLALPRRSGVAVLMGVAPPSVEVPLRPYEVFQRQLTIKGSLMRSPSSFRRAVDLLPRLALVPLVSDRFPLTETAAAIDHVRARRGVKTMIRMR